MTDGNQELLKFRKALREVFTSESGKTVTKFLERSYVDRPALCETSEKTAYKLGQKEFVQGLIKDANADLEDLEKMLGGNK